MIIKILGSGCANCKKLEENTKQAVLELKLEAVIEKITDAEVIMGYGIMSTPALLVDEKVVLYGYVPDTKDIKEMLVDSSRAAVAKKCGCSCGGKC